MSPRLAIHHRPGSYSDRWIASCSERSIPHVLVDCLDSSVLARLAAESCDGLLWHWTHHDARELMMARSLIMAAEAMGIMVFPSIATCWHFDDKIAQKYLLEAVRAPIVPSTVFYDPDSAHRWVGQASFPKVFKLRRGAGSQNVRLVRNPREARALIRKAFGRGFKPVASYHHDVRRRFEAGRRRGDLVNALRRLPSTLRTIARVNREMGVESGYVYFQDFIPNNSFDTRVTVIGERAFAFTRNVRPGDFRASGSGRIVYDRERIQPACVEIAFEVAGQVGAQSMAFDFVLAEGLRPLIVEVSYAYDANAVHACEGYWDRRLRWCQGHQWPQDAILVDLLSAIERQSGAGRGPSAKPGDGFPSIR